MARRTANRRAKMAPLCPPAANASRFDRRLARAVEVDVDDEVVEVDTPEGEEGEAMLGYGIEFNCRLPLCCWP